VVFWCAVTIVPALWLSILGGFVPAQEVIRAEDYSGFLKGDGYGWHGYAITNLPPLKITPVADGVMVDWPRTGMLQSASSLLGPWVDLEDVLRPCIITATQSQAHFRLRGSRGYHYGVGSGCPQQGFDFTGLPGSGLTNAHWANSPATADTCGWIVRQEKTGFANEPDVPPPEPVDFVRIVTRGFHTNPPPPDGWSWWGGNSDDTWEDNADHQNEGWFHFRVRHPAPDDPPQAYRLRFEVCFDNCFHQRPAAAQHVVGRGHVGLGGSQRAPRLHAHVPNQGPRRLGDAMAAHCRDQRASDGGAHVFEPSLPLSVRTGAPGGTLAGSRGRSEPPVHPRRPRAVPGIH
jgi:hypothetical protein